MRTPNISIGMPVYNGERFLREAVESLLNQTYDGFELVISDNGSTDESPEILRKYARLDRRVRIELNATNRGACWNFNRVLELADRRCAYMKWSACDDVHDARYLESTIALLESHPDAVLAHTNTADIDEEGFRIKTYRQPVAQLTSPEPARRIRDLVTFRHECFQAFGLIRHDVVRQTRGLGAYPGADNVLLIEIALRGRFMQADQVRFFRRQHEGRSMLAYRNQRERAAWFDPRLTSQRIAFPTWKLAGETMKAIRDAPLTSQQRRDCYRSLSILLENNWQNLLKNVVRSVAESPAAMLGRLTDAPADQGT